MLKGVLNSIIHDSELTQSPNNVIKGMYGGYYTVIDTIVLPNTLSINVLIDTERNPMLISELTAKLTSNKVYGSFRYTGKVFTVVLSKRVTSAKIAAMVRELLDTCVSFFRYNMLPTCCAHCGETMNPIGYTQIGSQCSFICDNCYQAIETSFVNQKIEAQTGRSNVLLGIIGALLGAFIGGALWVLVAQMGYIAAIVGFAIAALALKGYELLGGRLTKTGIVVSILAVIVTIYFAQNISMALEIQDELNNIGAEYNMSFSFSEAYKLIPDALEEAEIRNNFIKDLVLGYVFTAVASFSLIKMSFQKASGSYKLRRL